MKLIALAVATFLLWPTLLGGGEVLLNHPNAGPAFGLGVLAVILYNPRKGLGHNAMAVAAGVCAIAMIADSLSMSDELAGVLASPTISPLLGPAIVLACAVGGVAVMFRNPAKKQGKGKH